MALTTTGVSQEPAGSGTASVSAPKPREAIIIIHGTFASAADWIQPGSQLLQGLGYCGKDTIRTFIWSGMNSHKARIEAGHELASFAEHLCYTENFDRIWCVAHSHGGNVALYALRDGRFSRRIAGFVFFGTPFLHVRKKNLQRFCNVFTNTISWFILIPIYIPFIMMGLVFAAELLGTLAWAFQMYLGNAIGALAYMYYRPRLQRYADRKLLEFLTRKQDQICKFLAQPRPTCPTYVATVSRDEAALWLTSIDSISLIPWIGLALAGRMVLTLVSTLMALMLGETFVDDTLQNLKATFPLFYIVFVVAVFIILGPLLATPFVAALRGTRFAFGAEGLVAASTVRIRPSNTPFWAGKKMCLVKYPPNRNIRGYRHCFFYKDQRVINDVAAWIQSNGQARINPARTASAPRAAMRTHFLQWGIPVLTSIAMIAIYLGLTVTKINEVSGVKSDLAADVDSIRHFAAPTLEIDQKFAREKEFVLDPFVLPKVVDTKTRVPTNATCIIEGVANLFNWDTSVEVDIHGLRPLSAREQADDYFRERSIKIDGQLFWDQYQGGIWSWNSSRGKIVQFRRRFRNSLPMPTTYLALRVWNKSADPVRVKFMLFASCS